MKLITLRGPGPNGTTLTLDPRTIVAVETPSRSLGYSSHPTVVYVAGGEQVRFLFESPHACDVVEAMQRLLNAADDAAAGGDS